MKTTFILSIFIFISIRLFSQTTLIPDSNFEQKLIDLGYDTGTPNGFVYTSSIDTVTSLVAITSHIQDLTGIEDFISLEYLNVKGNNLSNIDVSKNTNLTILYCQSNDLTNLDVSHNTLLLKLDCHANDLTSLNISGNTALVELICAYTQLTQLDVSNNINLTRLICAGNQLTQLDVSNLSDLASLLCYENQLTILDVSTNSNLTELSCSSNQLTSLNVKNGNNSSLINFNAQNNPELNCIQVDDTLWSANNWTNIDNATSFSTDCNYTTDIETIDNNSFSKMTVYPNPIQDDLIINFDKTMHCVTIRLFNSLGQQLYSNNYNFIESVILNLDIPKGLYFLQLKTEKLDSKMIKIIKE